MAHLDIFYHQIVKNYGVAVGSNAQTLVGEIERQSKGCRPLCILVGEGDDLYVV